MGYLPGTFVPECAFCDDKAVAIAFECTVCRKHKDREVFRNILAAVIEPIMENFAKAIAEIDEEMKYFREMRDKKGG